VEFRVYFLQVVMHVLKHLSFIEDKYLRVLVRDKELYQVCHYFRSIDYVVVNAVDGL